MPLTLLVINLYYFETGGFENYIWGVIIVGNNLFQGKFDTNASKEGRTDTLLSSLFRSI